MVRALVGLFSRHWKIVGLVLLSVLALASAVYAYWRINTQTTLTPSTESYAVALSPPLELRIELDKTEFQLGETVNIRLFLKNISNQTTTVVFPYVDGKLGFNVKDSSDEVIYIRNPGVYPMFANVTLAPGGQISETLDWSQVKETPERQPVDPGAYKIIGRAGRYWSPLLETQPIIIVIG